MTDVSLGVITHGGCGSPSISADGRFVAYFTNDPPVSADVFLRDRQTETTQRASVNSNGESIGAEDGLELSSNGRFVAFTSVGYIIYEFARETGRSAAVMPTVDHQIPTAPSRAPAISTDGRFVAFERFATNLVFGDTNGTGGSNPITLSLQGIIQDDASQIPEHRSLTNAAVIEFR
ncbi:MAG: hypothetical protein HYR85_26695 [Planctomycetes bacterium]|nr:hypothetical protein [Planctomycetota bacterium]MBI3847928.1 hypothetical protein [Planctomycetota bacterium]